MNAQLSLLELDKPAPAVCRQCGAPEWLGGLCVEHLELPEEPRPLPPPRVMVAMLRGEWRL